MISGGLSKKKPNYQKLLAFGFDTDEKVEVIDLRALPEDISHLVKAGNIYPGYHMNKKHWITIIFDSSVSIEEILCELTIVTIWL